MSNSAFAGGLLSVAMRWTDRLVGLTSSLILARLLTPGDFGLVAMAMIAVGLVDVMLDLGVAAALLQNRSADSSDFDTAWTLRMCQAIVAAAVLFLGAPLIASYYGDERVTTVTRVIAASVLVGGFENIGIVMFQKQMDFARDFRFFAAKRVLGAVITVVLAVLLRSYWALVVGSLCGRVAGVGLSYVMSSYRPKWSLARVRGIWGFSQWNLVMNVASYLNLRLDKVVIGRRTDAAMMGAYSLGDEIASMPTTELLAPLGRVMFPAFVRAREDTSEFKRVVLLAFGVQAVVGIPAGAGTALVASEAIPLLLGAQWNAAIPIAQVLGWVGVITSLMHSSHYMLLALGRIRTLAAFYLIQLLGFISVLLLVIPGAGATNVAIGRLSVAVAGLFVMQGLAKAAVPSVDLRALWAAAWRPLVATALMFVAVITVVSSQAAGSPASLLLLVKIAVGVVTYSFALALLWELSGRPAGAEAYLLQGITARLRWRTDKE